MRHFLCNRGMTLARPQNILRELRMCANAYSYCCGHLILTQKPHSMVGALQHMLCGICFLNRLFVLCEIWTYKHIVLCILVADFHTYYVVMFWSYIRIPYTLFYRLCNTGKHQIYIHRPSGLQACMYANAYRWPNTTKTPSPGIKPQKHSDTNLCTRISMARCETVRFPVC